MEAMREQWSDNRLDDLNQKTDKRFEAVEGGLATQRDEMTEAVNRLDGKIDKQGRELGARIDKLTAAMTAEFTAVRGESAAEFAAVRQEMKDGFDRLYRLMVSSSVLMIAALVGLIATQL